MIQRGDKQMRFEFATASRIIFGPGTIREAAPLAALLGRRALVVVGKDEGRASFLIERLRENGVESSLFSIAGEPQVDNVVKGARIAQSQAKDLVIGMGGGSAIDGGKAIAALVTNKSDIMDYLEVIGAGKPLENPSVPYIAIPTTAGTGSEVTRNVVLASPEHRVKVSMRSAFMMPRFALIDPETTYSLPPETTASTGFDALAQLIEPYVCISPNPLIDGICREGISRAAHSLILVYENGNNPDARSDMALAALFGGIALANAKLGAVHGLAAPIGGMFPAPHGAVCARLLPIVVEANVRALQARSPDSPSLKRYDELAQLLTGKAEARATDCVRWLYSLCERLRVKPLSSYGLSKEEIPSIVTKAQKASSMKGNPISLAEDELTWVLAQAI
jgi:alcohol dehydrogenase class IV